MTSFVNAFFYWAHVRTWVTLLLAVASDSDVQGRENVPKRGAFILVANHMNTADPPIITHATPRRISWMTKRELFDMPVFGLMYKSVGFIPVRRKEADLQALRKSQEALQKGGVLGVFPEGTRSLTKSLGQGEPGAAVLALRTGAAIVPVAIWGTETVKLPRDMVRRTRVHVRFGKPFTLQTVERINREAAARGTETIMRAIADLLPPRYRGAYAEAPAEPAPAAPEGKR
jgi:1-acyl-sn-glycerol-3-phosphate acyltransferase